ncbi:MAG: tail fiber domain-containing protein [Holophagaceae bacterium]
MDYTTLITKNSAVASKRPSDEHLTLGELALNLNSADPGLYYKDTDGAVRKVGGAHVGSMAPNSFPSGNPDLSVGELWYVADIATLYIWTGSTWDVAGVGANTVLTTDTGVITSDMLADGTITNTDIASDADITVGKLAAGSPRQVLQTDQSGVVGWTDSVSLSGTLDVTGNTTFASPSLLSSGTATAPSLAFSSDTDTGLFRPATNTLGVATNGLGRLLVDASGRVLVGLGSASGSSLLQVSGDITTNSLTVGRGNSSVLSNTAVGQSALYANTTAQYNTALGNYALTATTTGGENTALGSSALTSNTAGTQNTAVGASSLAFNTTGGSNTSLGYNTLFFNTTGGSNATVGRTSLYSNTTGSYNAALGRNALYFNTTGSYNAALGLSALRSNTSGNYNVAVGYNGLYANTTGSGNVMLGGVTSTGSYSPAYNPTTENDRVSVGSTATTNAYIQVAWSVVSDARDKVVEGDVELGLDFVRQLEPKAFRFRQSRGDEATTGPTRYGFIAQDILALEGADSVIIDAEDPDRLRYNGESLVPVLVNAIKELIAENEAIRARLDFVGI